MKHVLFWVGIPATLVAGVTAAWAALDYLDIRPVLSRDLTPLEQQVASNSRTLAFQEFKLLEAKIQRQGWQSLSVQERRDYCKYAEILKFRVPQCR